MELFFYKCLKPNFGDELNTWMWPRLMEGVWEQDDNSIFVGIGSIINNRYDPAKTKIVFGAGYGGYAPLPTLDESWKFFFVRGKLTAERLSIDPNLAVGDSAILLRSCVKSVPAKQFKVSFMPHWETTYNGNWEFACKLAGIHYIDPSLPVEDVMHQLQASELVVTEAMHGAIVADALRVPWIAIKPFVDLHSMKWYDWASALDINLSPVPLVTSSLLESLVLRYHEKNPTLAGRLNRRARFLKGVGERYFAERAAERLTAVSQLPANLSSDQAMLNAHETMLDKMHALISFLGKGRVLVTS
ncbi:polysaccharide pyruvyl transferase family protein [Methylovorus glucosotrophus]|uniref:ExoV-like protein n=1 Tax=Methylovorus glucosotrophus (strain SIP3-4) TaxID=582744 RepID=C6X6T1_METGS|nr:polysaccharide pyruvyl transferase family protein [Methylovorus glucosotrophus]ACT51074.1 ExoV-like protein [Methylovorus glucosotrophus SIP3-4]